MLLQLQLIMWVFVAGRALEIQKEGACTLLTEKQFKG